MEGPLRRNLNPQRMERLLHRNHNPPRGERPHRRPRARSFPDRAEAKALEPSGFSEHELVDDERQRAVAVAAKIDEPAEMASALVDDFGSGKLVQAHLRYSESG